MTTRRRSHRLGVVLMTYGSPAGPDDMERYLTAVRGGRPVADEVLTEFRRRYEVIGGSPLVPITMAQAAALEEHLLADGVDARVVAGMRFSEPSIEAVVHQLAEEGCDDVVGIVMSPQHSELLMSGYRRALTAAASAAGYAEERVRVAPAWYRNERFIAAVALRIAQGLEALPAAERGTAAVLLTAHSLPRRVADQEPDYLAQLRETATLVALKTELAAARWHFCWQSAGHDPGDWMRPDFADLVPELAADGHRAVLVAPIQFLADHLEVLYDIDVGARAQAAAAGLAFARIASLNVLPQFIAALAETALHAAADPASQQAR